MTDTTTTPSSPAPYDWSSDPESAELLLDAPRVALDALVVTVREVVEVLAPTEGSPDDGCAVCLSVERLRGALRGVELTLGSES